MIALIIAVVIVICWIFMKSMRRTEMLAQVKSEALLYVESTEDIEPFIVYGLVKKQTDDETKHKKALTLASEKKKLQLIDFLKTL